MARNPKNNRFILAAGILGVAFLALVIFGLSAVGVSKAGFNKLPVFPVDSFIDGDSMWSNTDYVINGTFQNILVRQQSSDCTLCSILTEDKKIPLPVVFTPSACKTPLQREQKIKAKVRVDDSGRIVASDCQIQ